LIHPAIRDLFLGLSRHPAFLEVQRAITSGQPCQAALSGLTATAKALYAVLLWMAVERPLLVVVDGNRQAEVLSEAVRAFFDMLATGRGAGAPQILPALDVLPGQRLSPHAEINEQRAVALWRLATERVPITVLPVGAALLRTEPPEFHRQLALTLRVGEEVPMEDLARHLESIGYDRREPVEMVGEYSIRGGILDVFPPEAAQPVRLELFGDLIESMRRFEVETQRSVVKIPQCTLLPLLEHPKSAALFDDLYALLGPDLAPRTGAPFPGWEALLPLVRPRQGAVFGLLEEPVVLWDEPEQIQAAAGRLWKRLEEPERAALFPPERIFFSWEELLARAGPATQVALRELEVSCEAPGRHISSRPSMTFQGNVQVAVSEARNLVAAGGQVVFFGASTGELERLADIFQEYEVPFQLGLEPSESLPPYLMERSYLAGSAASTYLVKGLIRRGVVFPEARLAVFGWEDLFGTSGRVARPEAARASLTAFAADLADLKPGDYVVHREHGVGRFLGLRELAQAGQAGDYMLLEYSGQDKLYVPLARMDLVQKYRGAGEHTPGLDRLGGVTWNRTRTRVRARLRDMADELVKLYAERRLAEGFSFSQDSNWQREFEDAFEFVETGDQLTAIRDIKRDMEQGTPMDRLLCGDVGYGKTEVAMRAAFKALGDGKQVAVLAPTTVLCFQHYETFQRRFAPFPVRVEMLSRFRSAKEIKAILPEVADGKVDILIGTHRLLYPDVEFRDLGLLVVDEEQRFGVRHKERLKQLQKNVDVLTMTATPIPRTLHMSLVGLRDLSVIETPPKDRLAIHTVVAPFEPELIRAALEQELGRSGQVYYIHNRVDTIWERAAELQALVPWARVTVGHGQMSEALLEKAMLGFMQHRYDVLLSTTIVENGIDIPLANTIVVEHAERYGLSELYQLRGRVGRSNRRAYAYLLVPPDAELSELARKRLAALKEFSDLGAGFKIAALDLELRGAGNLLGGEQHGHINAVGFDMYLRMLEEAIRELKGEEVPPEIHTSLNLGLDLRIPPDYIADEHQRLRAYKRIAEADTAEQAARVRTEMGDRYGPPPEAVLQLLEYSLLKSLAQKLGIDSVQRKAGWLEIKFHEASRADPQRLMELVRRHPGTQFTPAGLLRLPLEAGAVPAAVLESLKRQLSALRQ